MAEPLPNITATFKNLFADFRFKHELPAENVEQRCPGIITSMEDGQDYSYGDAVSFVFGQSARGEFLDLYSRNRFGDLHLRIHEDGSTQSLETVPIGRLCSNDTKEDARLEAEHYAEVKRITELLRAKGFEP